VRYFFFVLTVLLHNFWVLVNLFAQAFSLWKISLSMLKDIAGAILGFAPTPRCKHPQRKLWVAILLGKNTTVKCCMTLLSYLYSFFQKPLRRNGKFYTNILDFLVSTGFCIIPK